MAGAPPLTPLGELTALPRPLAGFKWSFFYRKGRGQGSERKGGKGNGGRRECKVGREGGEEKGRIRKGGEGDSPYQS